MKASYHHLGHSLVVSNCNWKCKFARRYILDACVWKGLLVQNFKAQVVNRGLSSHIVSEWDGKV